MACRRLVRGQEASAMGVVLTKRVKMWEHQDTAGVQDSKAATRPKDKNTKYNAKTQHPHLAGRAKIQ